MRVTGIRGVGKTVLLGAFAERAEEANWEPAELEFQPSHNTDETLQDVLVSLLQRAQARLSRFERLRAVAGRPCGPAAFPSPGRTSHSPSPRGPSGRVTSPSRFSTPSNLP